MAHFNRSAHINDADVIKQMKQAMTNHLQAGILECMALSRDLATVDSDQLVTDIQAEFCPHTEISRIQDCFADAFHSAESKVSDVTLEQITERGQLPSGAWKPIQAGE